MAWMGRGSYSATFDFIKDGAPGISPLVCISLLQDEQLLHYSPVDQVPKDKSPGGKL